MRQILLMMVLVALVGCGKKEPAQPSASKPEPTKDKTTAGTKLWEFETGGDVGSSPAIGSDGTVYVGSYDKKLHAFRTDSRGPAKSPWPMFGHNAQRTGRVK